MKVASSLPPSGPVPAILCRGLKKSYGDVRAVDGLDLEIRAGRVLRPARPERRRQDDDDRDPRGADAPRRRARSRSSAATGERTSGSCASASASRSRRRGFSDKLTVFETLDLFRSLYPRGRDPERLLADLSLEEKQRRARRQALGRPAPAPRGRLRARGRPGDPLPRRADDGPRPAEPPPALGASSRASARPGATVLLTTHYMEEAERLCDRVAIVDHGKIIAQGTPGRARRRPAGARTSSSSPRSRRSRPRTLKALPGVRDCRRRDDALVRRRRLARRRGAGAPRAARARRREARLALDAPRDARGRLHLADGTGAPR